MVLLISDDRMIEHDPGPLHPEAPARLRAVLDALSSKSDLSWREPQPATHSHVARVHTPEHIARIDALRGREGYLDPDTSVSAASVQAAYLAAGALVDSVTATVNGESAEVFALVRPPGHHAASDLYGGYCYLNNAAIAAQHFVDETHETE